MSLGMCFIELAWGGKAVAICFGIFTKLDKSSIEVRYKNSLTYFRQAWGQKNDIGAMIFFCLPLARERCFVSGFQ